MTTFPTQSRPNTQPVTGLDAAKMLLARKRAAAGAAPVAGPTGLDAARMLLAQRRQANPGMGDVKAFEATEPAVAAEIGFNREMQARTARLSQLDTEIDTLAADLRANPTDGGDAFDPNVRQLKLRQLTQARADLLANNERAVPVNVGLPNQRTEPQGFIGSAVGAFSGGMQDVGDIPATLNLVGSPTGTTRIEDVNRFVTNLQTGRNRPQSQGAAVFGQAAQTGAGEMFRQMVRQPGMMLQGAVDQSAQSLGGQAGSIAGGALAALGGQPALGLGMLGAGSAAAELNGELANALQEIGGVQNLGDAAAIMRALNDPRTGPAIRQRVLTKAGTIGVVDALTAKASNMIPGGRTLTRQIGSATAKMGTEVFGGGGGEALGSVLSGQDVNSGAVLAEMLGEVGPGAAQITALAAPQLLRPTRAPATPPPNQTRPQAPQQPQQGNEQQAGPVGGVVGAQGESVRPAPFQAEIDAQARIDAYKARRAAQATPPEPVGGEDVADPSGVVTPGNTGERAGVEFSDADLDSFYAGQRRKQNERETAEDTSLRSMGLDPARMRQQLYAQRMRERFAIDRELNAPVNRVAPQPNADEVTDSERMREIANVLSGLNPDERAVVVAMIRQGYQSPTEVNDADVAVTQQGGSGLAERQPDDAGAPVAQSTGGPVLVGPDGVEPAVRNARPLADEGGPVAALEASPVSVATSPVATGVGGVVGTEGEGTGTPAGDVGGVKVGSEFEKQVLARMKRERSVINPAVDPEGWEREAKVFRKNENRERMLSDMFLRLIDNNDGTLAFKKSATPAERAEFARLVAEHEDMNGGGVIAPKVMRLLAAPTPPATPGTSPDFASMKLDALRAEAARRGLPTNGTKKVLVAFWRDKCRCRS